jgi:hypothetical protein
MWHWISTSTAVIHNDVIKSIANIHFATLSDYFQILNQIVIKYYILQTHINSNNDGDSR